MPVKVYKIALHDSTEVGSTAVIGLMVVIIFEDYLIFLKLMATSEKDPEM
jgi:hypothetical protein